jgi:hypothetical protein
VFDVVTLVTRLQVRRSQVRRSGVIATCFLAFALCLTSVSAHAQSWVPDVQWFKPWGPCAGNCAVLGYVGRSSGTEMTASFSLDSGFGPNAGSFVAPWNWDWQDSYIAAATFSRRVARIGNGLDIELEVGAGKRFGDMQAGEFWGAVYFRWTEFPWNKYLRTTVAISTGLSYATEIEALELERGHKDESGSHLLHFLSPEITFALPSQPNLELVFRFHHRSGGSEFLGDVGIFNGVSGGAHHGTVGARYRF